MERSAPSGTKEKILLHAAEIFSIHGYRGTTIRMIADDAKVNSALINYYYGDKETLYLKVMRHWADDAFRDFPFDLLENPEVAPEEKVRAFIYHTLLALFGPDGKGTGFGRLIAHEAAITPSGMAQEIVFQTIAGPTQALMQTVEAITGNHDSETLRLYTACIVGQTVYFFLSRNLTGELFGAPQIGSEEDIEKLSERIYRFSIAALWQLKEKNN